MIVLTLSLILAVVVGVAPNPTPTPTPSVLSCYKNICTDGDNKPFYCDTKDLLCCPGGANDSFQVFTRRNGFDCCAGAGEMYNIQRQICVGGQVRLRGAEERNCGADKAYNTTEQVCCASNVFDKIPGVECCGNKYPTDPNESCCNGMIYKISEKVCCPRRENNPLLGKFELFDIPYGKCCLGKPYSPTNQTCTREYALVDGVSSEMRTCRRGERYDPETHGCCRGAATTVYEKRRHLCHIGVLYKKTDPQQNDVCIFFDANTEQRKAIPFAKNPKTACSRNGVISLGPLEAKCGSGIYNTSKDLCCGEKVHENAKRRGMLCCIGTNAYNPRYEVCCMNEVKESMAYNDGARCCRKHPYMPATHDCREGEVVKKACPAYDNRCNVTLDALRRMSKVYLYFGIPKDLKISSKGRKSTKKLVREWSLTDMQTFKVKKGKVSLAYTKGKGKATLKALKCGCPENLEIGKPYIFASASPIRRKILSFENEHAGFIVPVENREQVGLIFEALIDNRKS